MNLERPELPYSGAATEVEKVVDDLGRGIVCIDQHGEAGRTCFCNHWLKVLPGSLMHAWHADSLAAMPWAEMCC
ncbi:MAG: hypothetical protein KL840_07875 [Aquamicrobium sp.]|nr:hypothetical protein [Aquamicrobium sp.]